MATTPLEREILTHYATTARPYRDGTQNWTETHVRIVRRFLDLGLLIAGPGADGLTDIRPNEEALRVYLAALAQVPLPVRRWVVPSSSAAPGGPATDEPPDSPDSPRTAPVPERTSAPVAGTDGHATQARVAELERQLRELESSPRERRRPYYEGEED